MRSEFFGTSYANHCISRVWCCMLRTFVLAYVVLAILPKHRSICFAFSQDSLPISCSAHKYHCQLQRSSAARIPAVTVSNVVSCFQYSGRLNYGIFLLAAGICIVGTQLWRRDVRHTLLHSRARIVAQNSAEHDWKDHIQDEFQMARVMAKTVFKAFLDIFKDSPTEATDKEAPGLRELGSRGVLGALSGHEISNLCDGSLLAATDLITGAAFPTDTSDTVPFRDKVMVLFLTHFGDCNAWEVAQQLRTAFSVEHVSDTSRVVAIGIGTVEAGRKFKQLLDLPDSLELYADPAGSCHKSLGFGRGALPQYASQLNPYFRVLLMLLGVGSPGTLRAVFSGYMGDTSLPPERTAWVHEALKQGAAKGRFPTRMPRTFPWEEGHGGEDAWVDLATAGSTVWDGCGFDEKGLRPFELATVRLQNLINGILDNWSELKPPDDELLVQLGGAAIIKCDGEVLYFYRDKGMLTYVPFEDLVALARSVPSD